MSAKAAQSVSRGDGGAHHDRASIDDYLALSRQCLKAGAVEDAIETLRAAQRQAPYHLGVLSNLGGLLSRQGAHDEALALLRQVLAQTPNSAVAHCNLAIGLRAAGEPAAAIEHFEAALTRRPDFAEAHRRMGDVLLDLDRLQDAATAYDRAVSLRRDPSRPPPSGLRLDGNRSRLRHDAEQFRYLVARGNLPPDFNEIAARYDRVAEFLCEPNLGAPTSEIPGNLVAIIAPTYDRLIHRPAAAAVPGGALNPDLDVGRIEGAYLNDDRRIAHFDGLLNPEALSRLLTFARESTVWFHHRYGNGYLGAFFDDGFCCPLLVQIAQELRLALPRIFHRHPLRRLWAFKYDHRHAGVPLHADAAAINVNFWLTPDTANRDLNGGGLILWDKRAPSDCDFGRFVKDEAAIRRRLAENGAAAVAVPYRQNRAVIFDSDLYHETGPVDFRDGYENRRINVTMLFGRRGG
jgi:tetratricopeptide (TPR) repeat protein